jgi:RimJ/RimL family protein N-acetyltransferase
MQPVTLQDGPLLLSVPTADDADRVTVLCQDALVQAWTTVPSPYLPEHGRTFVEEYVAAGWREDRERTWAIRLDGVLHGMVGMSRRPVRSAEVGYWLGPQARGRGVLHRSLALVLDHAFAPDGMDLDRVEWRAYAGNWASWRAVWRHGFRFEGAVRGGGVQRDQRRDEWLGTLLRGDPREPAAPWPATTVPPPQPEEDR